MIQRIYDEDEQEYLEKITSIHSDLAERMMHEFSPLGQLSKSPQYEYRPQQQGMAKIVAEAINEQRGVLIEAATGVGKSLAYLLPAVIHAIEKKKKAIITTHTIHLQEQIFEKDLKIIAKLTAQPFKAVLLKGRANYLCPTRLKIARSLAGDLFAKSEAEELDRIVELWKKNQRLTLNDLTFTPSPKVWAQICSEAHACTPRKCPPISECQYQEKWREAEQADIVILNHSLLFMLAANGEDNEDDTNFIFPNDFLVIDEAHTIENIAAKAFGLNISEHQIRYELNKLYNPQTRKGYFQFAGEKEAVKEVQLVNQQLEVFFDQVKNVCQFKDFRNEHRLRQANLINDTITPALSRVIKSAESAGDAAEREGVKEELHEIGKRLDKVVYGIKAFIDQELEEHVYWVEKYGLEKNLMSLQSAPVDVSELLQRFLFQGKKTAVLTSATLSVNHDLELNYFANRIGANEIQRVSIESPFDYNKQMKLYIGKSMPDITANDYEKKLIENIIHFLDMSEGRAFVLFTSYKLMQSVAIKLEEFCQKKGFQLLVQGKGLTRHKMLEIFKKDVHSVLLGTDSFWTGVDVPGEALSNVIITRLPFAVPDHPITASRLEWIEKQGRNAFMEYSVPEAILKLKQGIGRLIRSNKDHGICVILDGRVVTKPYGRAFLASIPECPTEFF